MPSEFIGSQVQRSTGEWHLTHSKYAGYFCQGCSPGYPLLIHFSLSRGDTPTPEHILPCCLGLVGPQTRTSASTFLMDGIQQQSLSDLALFILNHNGNHCKNLTSLTSTSLPFFLRKTLTPIVYRLQAIWLLPLTTILVYQQQYTLCNIPLYRRLQQIINSFIIFIQLALQTQHTTAFYHTLLTQGFHQR